VVIETNRTYRDVFWLILFVVHLVITFGLLIAGAIAYRNKPLDPNHGTFILNDDVTNEQLRKIAAVCALAAGLGILLSFIWSIIMRTWPSQMIYISICVQTALYVAIAITFFVKGVWVAGIIFALLGAFQLLLFVLWRSRIPFAKEMLRAVVDVSTEFPATVATAYLSLLALVAWYVAWVAAVIFVQRFSSTVAYILTVYLIFSFYWVCQVIKNVVHVTVAGLYATVYFLRGSGFAFPENPTVESFGRASTTSLGSICLGSLLVAILQTARMLLRMLRGNNNGILAAIADCFLACIEGLIRYFNKWAFAQVAIYGRSFCEASRATWDLLRSHGFEAIVNDNLISYVLSTGCLAGGALCGISGGAAGWFVIQKYWILCAVLSFIIGFTMFLMPAEVIDSGVTSYFVCFAQDPEILRRTNPDLYGKLVATYSLSWV